MSSISFMCWVLRWSQLDIMQAQNINATLLEQSDGVDSISLKCCSKAFLALCDAAKCFNLVRELFFLTVQSKLSLVWEQMTNTVKCTFWSVGKWSEKKKSNSSRIVLFHWSNQSHEAWCASEVSSTKGGVRWAKRWSIFSSFLMFFALLLSSGPLSLAALPGVEFIKCQSCQLSQKSPHHSAVRGGAWEKNLWHGF